jgi:hypothetical protein
LSPQTLRPADYELVPGVGYYKLHVAYKTWDEAVKTCLAEGSHLLVLNSVAEADAANYMFTKHSDYITSNYKYFSIHLGLKKGTDGRFFTNTGNKIVCKINFLGKTKSYGTPIY